MRFHIGFSKYIKPSFLIKLLGSLFLCFLFLIGCDRVNAWETIENIDFINWQTSYYNNIENGIDNVEPVIYTGGYFYNSSNVLYGACSSSPNSIGDGCWNQSSQVQYNQYYFAYSSGSQSWSRHYTNDFQFNFYDDDKICSSDSSYKSVDWRFALEIRPISNTFSTSALNAFNINNIDDMYFVTMTANDLNDNYYNTSCEMELESSSSSIIVYNVYCNNVYTSSSITNYKFNIHNKLGFSNAYASSGSNYIMANIGFYNYPSSSVCGYNCKTEYQCSTNSPIIEGNDDPLDLSGLGSIYESLEDLGINVNDFVIPLPSNIQELISLPIYVIDSIIQSGSTCEPYELDLSSLGSLSGNDNFEYKLYLPCMRTKLSSLLGALYTLIDILMASLVFYNIAMAIIQMIEAVTSGVDLYTYYFSNTREGKHLFQFLRGYE